jgi:uncharacterized protein YjeT (DUF2065 family)
MKAKSALRPIGALLIVAGLFLPRLVRSLAEGTDGPAQGLLFVSTDLLRLSIIVGIVLLVVGEIRTRRTRATPTV